MEKPIVIGVEGESRAIIRAANAGIGIEPENAAELAAAVEILYQDEVQRKRMGADGRKYVAKEFDRTVLAWRFEELMTKTITGVSVSYPSEPPVDGLALHPGDGK